MPETYTLFDADRYREEADYAVAVDTIQQTADIAKFIPFRTIGTTQITSKRRLGVPTGTWRDRGETFTGGRSSSDYVSDQTYNIGVQIDLDIIEYKDNMVGPGILTSAIEDHVTGIGFQLNDNFVNGDHAVDPSAPEGIKVRIANLASSQTVYAVDNSTALDVSLSNGSVTVTDFRKLFDALDAGVRAVEGHRADVGVTDGAMLDAIKRAARWVDVEVKSFIADSTLVAQRDSEATPVNGIEIGYNGLKLIDMGWKLNAKGMPDPSTPVVGTETIGSKATTPIYFLRIGERFFEGIQQYPMDLGSPHLLDDDVTMRISCNWTPGWRSVHPRFGSVLKGIAV